MKRRLAVILFTILFVISVFPIESLSAATVTISSDGSVDISATAGIVNPGDVINIADGVSVTLYGSSTDVRIICGQNVTLTIRDLNIGIGGLPSGSSIYFTGTGNTLLLEGSSSISGSNSIPGVRVEGSAAVTINSTSDPVGSLIANGGLYAAGIGGGYYSDVGTITIAGGTIVANGGLYAAGIGGGERAAGGTITISGGTVTARGGLSGAGIGGGEGAAGGTITISGGTVTARGGLSGAGIGGGHIGIGGTITISDGMVDASGGSEGAGIGGGESGASTGISISGGHVFATGNDGAQDIGIGESGNPTASSLSITGSAAVFLRYNNSLTPTTANHSHELIEVLDGGAVYGITVPSGWEPNFGAYLYLNTLTFDANNGTGSISSLTGLNGTSVTLPAGDAMTRTNYVFSGWNTAADGSGRAASAGDTSVLSLTETLFAQWTAVPTLSASTALPIESGESLTLTPNISGGTWDFDATGLSRDDNTFTGRVAGVYTIRYTVDGQSTTFDVTVVQPEPIPTLSPTPTVTSTSTATPAPTQGSANAGTGAPRTGEDSGTTLQILAVVAFLIATGSVGVLHVTRRRRAKTSSK